MINYVEAECNKPKVAGTTTGDLTIDSDKSLKYGKFYRCFCYKYLNNGTE